MASLSLLFNHFLTYPKHAHTHRSAYINIARCNFHVYAFWRTRTHTHAEPKKGKKQRYKWCDTIPRMPGQNWSVAHAFDVNPEHGHVTNADTKLHPVLLWSLKPHACFYRGNKIVCVCVYVCVDQRESAWKSSVGSVHIFFCTIGATDAERCVHQCVFACLSTNVL